MIRLRRGISLVELLVIIPILATVMALGCELLPVLGKEVPATWRAAGAQRQLTGALQRIGRDVDLAEASPGADALRLTDDNTLLIQTRNGVVRYVFADGGVTRSDSAAGGAPPQTWSMPEAVINWRIMRDNKDRAQALELMTAVKVQIAGRTLERLANSRVYYVNALQPAKVTK